MLLPQSNQERGEEGLAVASLKPWFPNVHICECAVEYPIASHVGEQRKPTTVSHSAQPTRPNGCRITLLKVQTRTERYACAAHFRFPAQSQSRARFPGFTLLQRMASLPARAAALRARPDRSRRGGSGRNLPRPQRSTHHSDPTPKHHAMNYSKLVLRNHAKETQNCRSDC
jgi:hypothetical protein